MTAFYYNPFLNKFRLQHFIQRFLPQRHQDSKKKSLKRQSLLLGALVV